MSIVQADLSLNPSLWVALAPVTTIPIFSKAAALIVHDLQTDGLKCLQLPIQLSWLGLTTFGAMASKNYKRKALLSNTRPLIAKKPSSLSSRATRSLIRRHHTLQKQLNSALAMNDTSLISSLKYQLSTSGGLPKYQEASIQGQSSERGGDSSRVFIEWLFELMPRLKANIASGEKKKLRMLEVGALRTDNACSKSGIFDVTRIDLHSQHPEIEQQDFMEMQAPTSEKLEEQGFEVVSLSLVVNYVGDASRRGEMLKRVSQFLRTQKSGDMVDIFPGLFLVLPASCVNNSRYLDEEKLLEMMQALGYVKVRRKISLKLVYYYWRYESQVAGERKVFRKQEVRQGGSRNNFAIVLR